MIVSPVSGSQINSVAFGIPLAAFTNLGDFKSLGGCSVAANSTSYANVTGGSFTWTKLISTSTVYVFVGLSAFSTVATTGMVFGVNLGSDVDATYMQATDANKHYALPFGYAKFTGLGVGLKTIQLRAKRNSGTGTVTMDSGDTAAMFVMEGP